MKIIGFLPNKLTLRGIEVNLYVISSQFITHNTLVEKHETIYTNQLERWKKLLV